MSPNRSRAGKVVLITGASSGIGAAIAEAAAARGYRLAITARRADRLGRISEQSATEVLAIPADLADPEAPRRILGATIDCFGRLDVLVNNAGIGLPGAFGESRADDLARQIQVNLTAPLVLTRLAIPHLIQSKGVVVNVGSAIRNVANPALGAYGATKAALAYWNDALRRELRHRGVRVCLVEAGPIRTEFFQAIDVPAAGSLLEYNPIEQPPPAALTTGPDDLARRVVRLFERPRRRLSAPRRAVWPFRLIGGVFGAWPWLGDVTISSIVRRFDRDRAGSGKDADVPSSR